MIDHNENEEIGMILLHKNISLFILCKGIETSVVWERDRDRETKTDGGFEGLGHCNINP